MESGVDATRGALGRASSTVSRLAIVLALAVGASPALAGTSDPAPENSPGQTNPSSPPPSVDEPDDVVVTGIRRSLSAAADLKR